MKVYEKKKKKKIVYSFFYDGRVDGQFYELFILVIKNVIYINMTKNLNENTVIFNKLCTIHPSRYVEIAILVFSLKTKLKTRTVLEIRIIFWYYDF